MIEKKQGGHTGKMSLTVGVNRLDDLLTARWAEGEVHPAQRAFHGMGKATSTRKHVQVFLGLYHVRQGDFCGGKARIKTRSNRATKRSLSVRGSCQEEDLVFLVEGHQSLSSPARLTRRLPSMVEVNASEKVLGLIGIVEAALFDYWNLRVERHEDHRKDAHAVSGWAAFRGRVDFYALDAA